ncbi:MAG: hypothetical protein CM1200mP29_11800 [Verrucomicrobiota bacterium]|nr:MAG: hypothetical protein CM1200mP29_11800 [Verrucomicrobiota bacterium]
MGFDVIGMTNLGEARCAREAEIAYATLAMVTDYDFWEKEEEEPVSVETVVPCLQKNATSAKSIIEKAIPKIPENPLGQAKRHLITRSCPRKAFGQVRPRQAQTDHRPFPF